VKASYPTHETRSTTEPRFDLVLKLLRFALDPSAREGEAQNAACRMVDVARREGVNYPGLEQFLGENFTPALPGPDFEPEPPAAINVRMTFGKYDGKTLGWIAENDLPYLEWLVENIASKPGLTRAAETVIDWYGGSQ
jgi:hypothetical protein